MRSTPKIFRVSISVQSFSSRGNSTRIYVHIHTHTHVYTSGNKIKKIANNSNRNCPGHIPSFLSIRSLGVYETGVAVENEREREERREETRETTLQVLISMHHLDPRAGLSDRFSFRGLAPVSGSYLLYTVLKKYSKNFFLSIIFDDEFIGRVNRASTSWIACRKRSTCGAHLWLFAEPHFSSIVYTGRNLHVTIYDIIIFLRVQYLILKFSSRRGETFFMREESILLEFQKGRRDTLYKGRAREISAGQRPSGFYDRSCNYLQ